MENTKSGDKTVTPFASLTVPAASVVPSIQAKLQDCIAFEAITQGQPVAFADPQFSYASAGGQLTVRLADATTNFKVAGLAATAGLPGQPIKVIISDPLLAIGGVVIGDVVYLGVTPGSLTVTYADITSGKVVQVLGVGIAVGKINMQITRSDTAK